MTASKIRFLEEKGLINPQRTPAGYRQYSENDVERLRFVLSLQRDQYLPLKVIKDYLDAIDRGERPENLPAGVTLSPRIVSEELALRAAQPGTQAQRGAAARRIRGERPLLESLLSYGLIGHVNGKFDEHALQVRGPASSWRAMAWNPATCGPSRPLPTANSGSWSVLWPP